MKKFGILALAAVLTLAVPAAALAADSNANNTGTVFVPTPSNQSRLGIPLVNEPIVGSQTRCVVAIFGVCLYTETVQVDSAGEHIKKAELIVR